MATVLLDWVGAGSRGLLLATLLLLGACGGGSGVGAGDLGTEDGEPEDFSEQRREPLRGSLGTGTGTARDEGRVVDPYALSALLVASAAEPPVQNGTSLAGALGSDGRPQGAAASLRDLSFTRPASWPPASATDASRLPLPRSIQSTSYAGAYEPDRLLSDGSLQPVPAWTEGWTLALDGRKASWARYVNNPRASGTCPAGTTLIGRFAERYGPLSADETNRFLGAGVEDDYDLCELPARYEAGATLTLSADNVYRLPESGSTIAPRIAANGQRTRSTLTIAAGTLLVAPAGSRLTVEPSAELVVSGSPLAPVTFTAEAQIEARFDDEAATDAEGLPGGWGGLVLLDETRTSACADTGCPVASEEGLGAFGGTGDAGSTRAPQALHRVQYLVLRNAGAPLADGSPQPALSLFGIGRGTRGTGSTAISTDFNFIQLHRNAGDAVRVRGGNAFLAHLLATGNGGSALRYADGWTGGLQFLLAIPEAGSGADAVVGSGRDSAEPISFPLLANLTVLGPASAGPAVQALRIERGSRLQLWNSVLAGDFSEGCLDLDDALTFNRAAEAGGQPPDAPGPHLFIRNSRLDCLAVSVNENG